MRQLASAHELVRESAGDAKDLSGFGHRENETLTGLGTTMLC
jgi:hypothetical protein